MERTMLVVASTIVGALTLFGCGDSGGDGGTAGTGGSAQTVTVELAVFEFAPGEANVPVPDAEVCVLDSSNCATSDAEGLVTLQVPANAETGFTVIAAGFTPTIAPQTTTDEDLTNLTPLLADTLATALAAILNTPYPFEGTGAVALSVLVAPVTDDDNGISGVTLTADRTATSYYLDEDEFPSLDLTETIAPSGAGGYIELAAGTLEITLGGTASNCIIVSGWAGSDASSVRVPIEVGFFTQAFVTCDPVSAP